MAAMIGAIFIKFGRAPTTFRIFTIAEPPLSRFCDYPRERQRDYGTGEQTETTRETFRPFRFFRLFRNPLGAFLNTYTSLTKTTSLPPTPTPPHFSLVSVNPRSR